MRYRQRPRPHECLAKFKIVEGKCTCGVEAAQVVELVTARYAAAVCDHGA
jgi:hypothetical protein